jgi:hypothetical protein
MASKVIVKLEDDLDGTEAAETVHFALEGVEYEIDLSEQNAAKLRECVAGYVEKARKIGGRGRRSRSHLQIVDSKSIRKWAEANGIELSTRGRIPADVISQYQAAGN